MKYAVDFYDSVTTERRVKAIVYADSEEDIKDQIEAGDYEVEDCFDCVDTDWKLKFINSAEELND